MLPAAAGTACSARPRLGWTPIRSGCDEPGGVAKAAGISHPTCPLLAGLTSSSSSNIHSISFGSSSSSSRRCSVIAADKRAKANPFVDVQRDVLPDGKPNTPWRRLKLRIQTTVSLQGLARIYSSSRHKSAVWRPIHSAGILMRLAALQYYRLVLPPYQATEQTSAAAHQLLQLLTPDLSDPRVCHVLDSARLAQLLVVLSALNPKPGPEVLDPLVKEIMRDGGKKLPAGKPDLLAEVAAGLARLEWREFEVWLTIAAAAKGLLRAAALQQQQQQQMEWLSVPAQQQQQQWNDDEQWQQQPDWDEQQLWLQLPLQQQQDWQQQQQQQHRGLPKDPAAAGSWLQDSTGYGDPDVDYRGEEDSELPGDFWGELDQEVYQEDEEELYEEDPSYWSLPLPSSNPTNMQWQQQQQQWASQQAPQAVLLPYSSSNSSISISSSPVWLSLCYPKLASALAAVGLEDPELMQLLGDAAVRVLPLLTAFELADLAVAYAQLGLPHHQLLPALAMQLTQCARSSSSSGGGQGVAGESEVAAVIRAAHALGQLAFADGQLVEAVQTKVLSSRSTNSSAQLAGHLAGQLAGNDVALGLGWSAAAVGPQQLVQLLQLLVGSGCTGSSSSSRNGGSSSRAYSTAASSKSKAVPLVRWVCNAVAGSGLEALQPLQLQSAAAALADLQQHPEAAAAAAVVGAAAVARAEECGPEVLAEVLWCCVTLGCANAVLAETAAAAAQRAAETLQQQQQQQQRKRKKKRPAKQAAADIAAGVGVQRAVVLGSKHQAQLVWSLQQIGRPDLVQRVVAAFQMLPML